MMTTATLVELSEGRFAHATGSLWLPWTRTALIADAHLGYGWALRRRGQLGPVQDGGARLKLQNLIAELKPLAIVFLGDLVHAPKPHAEERRFISDVVQELHRSARLVLVRGNHDRGFERDFPELPIDIMREWTEPGLKAVHGDRVPADEPGHLVMGHLHPALGIVDDAGASHKTPVFLSSRRLTVLPAFSPLAAGFDVRGRLPDELTPYFDPGEPCVVAATVRRAVRLGSLQRLRST